ncbi:MAG TPA: TonB-dependent receptor [Cyclobacteriaceae bacterium]|nr:TonB-dependent receptor [Cyclobacteriaceae bacterium]HRJ81028.1 TonB-dependent receptor [Cyclobacteriaceae bacterium]
MKKSFTAKLWKVMRICAVQAVIAITLCGVTLAHPNYAQVLDREISITIIDLPFEKALNEIEQVAKVKFGYSINQFQDEPNVSLSIEKKTLRDVLDELLTPRKIRYKVHEKEAAITLKKITIETEKDQSSIHDGSNGSAQHQALIQVTGTVTEASTRTPMAGVNVIVKGTTNGTTTDAAGRYSLGAENNDVLIFSFIGYASLEIPVNGRTVIDVVMTEDVLSLGEVIVNAGYWEVKDQERTGNIARVTSEEIQRQPVSNPLQALQGRMAGVQVIQNTGVPGGGFKIQIRGQNSLRSDGNDPLYVIDGVPFTPVSLTSTAISGTIIKEGNPLTAINPADIESIEILKDADATSIYGSRGANGVVLITTKRGQAGRTRFQLNFSQGVGKVGNYLDLLNTQQHVGMRREALQNDGLWPLPDFLQSYVPDVFLWDTTRYTNWQKELVGGTANTTNAQFSVSGGSENTQFSVGGGYYRETTVFPGDFNFQRLSGSLSLNHTSDNRKFKTSIAVNYSGSANNLLSQDLTSIAVTLPPNAPALYDENGNINWNWQNDLMQNPLRYVRKKYVNNTDNLITNASFSYEMITGLRLKTNVGYTSMIVKELSTNPLSAIPPQFLAPGLTGSSNFGDSYYKTWIIEPQADYTRTVGDGILTILAGGTLQESVQQGETISARGYTSDALLENIRSATSIDIINSAYSQYRYAALFGRVNYVWKEKYIVNLTGRRDGSSRFGPGRQFGNFGAAGAAWIFSNEKFVKSNLSFISFGKLRTSYGTTGSDAIGNYQYLNTFSSTVYPYNGSSGLVLTRLDNPDYSWETNRKFESGIELGFIKDRILFSASRYYNESSNQLVGLPLPVVTGQSSIQYNLPATVVNKGWEFQLTTANVKRDNFKWTTTVNITLPRNELTEFPNLEAFPAYRNQYKIGESIFIRKTLRSTGVDPTTGLYTFEDIDGDGNISVINDGLFLKEVSQRYFGGLGNSISIHGLQVDFLFQFVKQTGYNYINSFTVPGDFSNQPAVVTARWQNSGDQTGIQQYTVIGPGTGTFINQKFSDKAISDASFIRLKNVSVSWQFPSAVLKKVRMQNARLYLQGQNLLTITNYLGMDPENQNVSFLPPLRMVSLGAQITF